MTVPRAERFIASIYYETMRENFAAYGWDMDPKNPANLIQNPQRAAELAALKEQFEELEPSRDRRTKLGQLFEIELALMEHIPETALRARFWATEERFHRVVTKGIADAYAASLNDQPGTPVPVDALRQRVRTLLKGIHTSYIATLARESQIRNLMMILAVVAFVLLAIAGGVAGAVLPIAAVQGFVMLAIAGMAGAMISTIQRLQKATARHALVDDGIFELIGLRVGWVSILMSVGIGGVSALFIYVLVAGQLLDQVLPQVTGAAGGGGTGEAASAGAQASSTAPVATPGTCIAGCTHWLDGIYQALGLAERKDLFKMIGYAFASGFAERLVPDILNKLARSAESGTSAGADSTPPVT